VTRPPARLPARLLGWVRRRWPVACAAAFLLVGLVETALQVLDTRYVRSVTAGVLRQAGAVSEREKVVAIRDYLRSHVTFVGASYHDRPFVRATAAETLRSGKGYCGEVSRAFICMAATQGIHAQRINLHGTSPHLVAEAEIDTDESFVVDGQNPPRIDELEPLDQVMRRPQYDDYFTVNLRRLRVNWIVTRVKMRSGLITTWLERPHAIKAALWFALAGTFLFFMTGQTGFSPPQATPFQRQWLGDFGL
jgi:hypothetical protein